ncbi:hypothetical protein [Endozoicomonas sp. ONNA2]|uniref:hypothetical protein n=1 Tax=Endozoicomonas sp. ONNA2 TaxID=2828741 RepID=UPI0021475152|nr:hypothetical protein [Endozoicomonas sp. ONNA2]
MPATEVLPVKHEQLLSGQTFNTAGGKQLSERLVNLQPDLATQSDSRAEAIQMTARNLVEKFQFEAIEKSPTKEVLCAVFLECLITHCVPYSTTGKKLAETNALSGAEKVHILLASEEKLKLLHSARIWSRIPLSIRLEEAKNLFQRLPDRPEMDNEISVQLTTFNPDNLVKVSLLEIRQTLNSQNNELSTQLLSDVDHIEKKFIPGVKGNGHFLDNNAYRDFIIYTRKLLYLYAACSGYSQKADIAELVSYIRAVHYTIHTDNIWHIAKELAYLSKQPGSIDYCRYIAAVANILKAPAPVALQFEELKQLSDIRGFALLERWQGFPSVAGYP